MVGNKLDLQDSGGTATCSIVETVDARKLRCPLPLLKAKQALNRIKPGDSIEVLATDSGSVRDFHEYARLAGQTIRDFSENQGVYRYVITRQAETSQ